jgi:hypothetical protein
LCGFDHQTFASLHEKFKVEFEKYSPYSRHGRIRRRLPKKKGGPRLRSSIHKQATALRQLAEWGMRGLQGSFPCLKDHLLYEERGERRIILEMIVLLYNFRASTVEMNQIQSTFMPHLERSANKFVFNF